MIPNPQGRPWLLLVLMVVAAWIGAAGPVYGLYAKADLDNVPIERLIKNLEALVEKDAKNAVVRHNLARVHAMVYASKTDSVQVRKGKEEAGPWFGYEPKHVPFSVKPTDDPAKRKAAKEHLDKAIALYKEAIKLDAKNLTAQLGHAWCIEQSADKPAAVKAYREVIEAGWQVEKDRRGAPLGGHWITAEAAGYLTPLLDAEKDKEEIAMLKDRVAELRKRPRAVTPIAIPLRDGLAVEQLVDRSARVAFDADGSGLPQTWSWISREAGWLICDPHGTGKITSALQMYGSVTYWLFWENGYQALSALDDDGDGLLSGPELKGLAIWHDANANGISEPGEVRPLAAHGIVGLSCRYEPGGTLPDVVAFSPSGVHFRDGSRRPTYDVVLHRAALAAQAEKPASFSGLVSDKAADRLPNAVVAKQGSAFALGVISNAKDYEAFANAAGGLKLGEVNWEKQAVAVVILKANTNRLRFKELTSAKDSAAVVFHWDGIEPFYSNRNPAVAVVFDRKDIKKVVFQIDARKEALGEVKLAPEK